MDFFDNLLTESDRMVRETARKFALQEIRPHAFQWEEEGSFPRELYKKAADAGILGVGIAEDFGGSGGGPMAMVMAVEGLMQGGSTGVAAGLGSLGIGLPPILQSGDKELIQRYAPSALAGESICGLAITEPNTGSDVAGIQTRAVDQGDHYLVTGQKLFITSGVRADFLTTLVRTGDDPHGGLTFLVIDMDLPGVSRSAPLKKHGWWASDTAEISFDQVKVPHSRRAGPQGGGFLTLMQNFQTERLALAAYGVATAGLAIEESLRYARERNAFGKSLMGFQVTRHKFVDMQTRYTAVRTFLYQVARQMEAGHYLVTEVSMVKNLAAELAIDVCYDAVQIHGGMGYMRETLVERLSRDARLLSIGGGTQEIMKEIISKSLAL